MRGQHESSVGSSAAIPDAPSGLRDRAIVITLAPTGRRRSEVLNLKVRDITQDGGAASMESANYRDRRSRPEFPPRSPPGPTCAASARSCLCDHVDNGVLAK